MSASTATRAITAAAKAAIDRYGTSVSASRPVSGERPVHRELERALARLHGAEDSIALVGGHSTNVTVIGHLLGRNDRDRPRRADPQQHRPGRDAVGRPARAVPPSRPRRPPTRLLGRAAPAQWATRCSSSRGITAWTATSRICRLRRRGAAPPRLADGRRGACPRRAGAARFRYRPTSPGSTRARSTSGWGRSARAWCPAAATSPGEPSLIDYLKLVAPGFVFSVGMAPPAAAAALAAVELLEREPERVRRVNERAALFLRLARDGGLDVGGSIGAAIVPIITGSSIGAGRLAQATVPARRQRPADPLPGGAGARGAAALFPDRGAQRRAGARRGRDLARGKPARSPPSRADLAAVARHLGRMALSPR